MLLLFFQPPELLEFIGVNIFSLLALLFGIQSFLCLSFRRRLFFLHCVPLTKLRASG